MFVHAGRRVYSAGDQFSWHESKLPARKMSLFNWRRGHLQGYDFTFQDTNLLARGQMCSMETNVPVRRRLYLQDTDCQQTSLPARRERTNRETSFPATDDFTRHETISPSRTRILPNYEKYTYQETNNSKETNVPRGEECNRPEMSSPARTPVYWPGQNVPATRPFYLQRDECTRKEMSLPARSPVYPTGDEYITQETNVHAGRGVSHPRDKVSRQEVQARRRRDYPAAVKFTRLDTSLRARRQFYTPGDEWTRQETTLPARRQVNLQETSLTARR